MADTATTSQSVIVYSADWCAFCHAAKDYLTSKNISYQERNIEKDPAYAQESIDKSGQMGIPVLDINGQIIVGFDRPRINAALGI
jgi:glutaredoxin 3